MSKAVTWINPFINTAMCLLWISSSDYYMVMICCFAVFCEDLNFPFNLAMLDTWATAYLSVPQMVTVAGCTVLLDI